MSAAEARAMVQDQPLSFLHISRPEIDLPEGTDPYSATVYAKARENLDRLRDDLEKAEAELLKETADEIMANGGSCAAGPDGEWLLEPVVDEELLSIIEIDHARVLEERQNLDIAGHYSRPDVTRLVVDRRRQSTVEFTDEGGD